METGACMNTKVVLVTDLPSREHLGLNPLLGLRGNTYLWGNRVPHNATAPSIQWTPVVCFFSPSFFAFCLVLFVPPFPGDKSRGAQCHFLIWLHFLFVTFPTLIFPSFVIIFCVKLKVTRSKSCLWDRNGRVASPPSGDPSLWQVGDSVHSVDDTLSSFLFTS